MYNNQPLRYSLEMESCADGDQTTVGGCHRLVRSADLQEVNNISFNKHDLIFGPYLKKSILL